MGTGIDLLEVSRVEEGIREGGDGFLASCFTPGEIAYCGGRRYPARHFAARFAAKEAVLKALSLEGLDTGIWREVEVRSAPAGGKPEMVLHGRALARAGTLGVRALSVSLTHTDRLAAASVVLES